MLTARHCTSRPRRTTFTHLRGHPQYKQTAVTGLNTGWRKQNVKLQLALQTGSAASRNT